MYTFICTQEANINVFYIYILVYSCKFILVSNFNNSQTYSRPIRYSVSAHWAQFRAQLKPLEHYRNISPGVLTGALI